MLKDFLLLLCPYCIELFGQRCGSLSKHGLPPQVYAGLLSEDHEASIAALKKMKLDFKLLQGMEVSSAPLATSLAADLRLSVSAPIRLVMNAFEVCNFRLCPQAEGAVEILRVLVQKLPDTKCIEDLHQRIRSKQNSRSNDKLSLGCLQNIVIFSNIIEQRKLKHPAALSKQVFRQQYRSTKARNYNEKKMMRAKGHKLPKRFSRLMDPKIAWQSVTESNLVRSAAAWSWARKYHKRRLEQDGFEIQALAGFNCFGFANHENHDHSLLFPSVAADAGRKVEFSLPAWNAHPESGCQL